jgi:hypothetical protein
MSPPVARFASVLGARSDFWERFVVRLATAPAGSWRIVSHDHPRQFSARSQPRRLHGKPRIGVIVETN